MKDHDDVLEGVINTLEEIINRKAYKGIFTGLNNFDLIVGGFKNGCCYGIAGRTHMGKTEFGLEMALRCIEAGKRYYIAILSKQLKSYVQLWHVKRLVLHILN